LDKLDGLFLEKDPARELAGRRRHSKGVGWFSATTTRTGGTN
jgi:hypothetical protein